MHNNCMMSNPNLEKKFIPIKSLEKVELNSYVTLKGMITKFLYMYIYDVCQQL